MLKKTLDQEVCLTVTCLDGWVLARSAMHHSVNFRSAMLFGTAFKVEGAEAKLAGLKAMVEGLFPGRWDILPSRLVFFFHPAQQTVRAPLRSTDPRPSEGWNRGN